MPERSTTPTIVGYPGRDGAHSAAACDRLFPDGAELVALPSFAAVTQATADGSIDVGVLPIESSLVGPVAETHDLLYDSPLAIIGETVLAIRHFLVGPEKVPLAQFRAVHSHPVALDQCRMLLAAMPSDRDRGGDDRRRGGDVAEHGDPARSRSPASGRRLHGLEVIAEDVGDHPEAFTRFVSVATHMRIDVNGKPWRTAFSFVTDHQPGASTGRSSRSPAIASISSSSCPAPSPSRRGATASTPCSPDIPSTRSCARRSPSFASGRACFASSAPILRRSTMTDPTVQRLRDEISALDRSILDAVNRRIDLVAALRRHKQEVGLPFLDPERERQLLDDLVSANRARSRTKGLRELFRELLDLTKREVAGDGDAAAASA